MYLYMQSTISAIYSKDTNICFLNKNDSSTNALIEKYSCIVIISSHQFEQSKVYESKVFYKIINGNQEDLDREVELNKQIITQLFDEFVEDRSTANVVENIITEVEQEYQYTTTLPIHLYEEIKKADNVFITLGAGVSATAIPTFRDLFKKLDLVPVISTSGEARNDSMSLFVNKLILDPEYQAQKLDHIKNWGTKVDNKTKDGENLVKTTVCHEALLAMVNILEQQNKQVFIYTDNLDGIHKNVGLKVSEAKVSSVDGSCDYYYDLYPEQKSIDNKRNIVIICGQSFDFRLNVLSNLSYLAKQSSHGTTFLFFSINPEISPIMVKPFNWGQCYKQITKSQASSTDEEQKLEEQFITEIKKIKLEYLNMQHIPSTCEEVLVKIKNQLQGFYSNFPQNTTAMILWQSKKRNKSSIECDYTKDTDEQFKKAHKLQKI